MKSILFFLITCVLFGGTSFAQDVYVTKTGEKYHIESCQYLRYSKIKIDLDQAKERGFTACVNFPKSKTIKSKKTSTSDALTRNKPATTRKVTASQCTGRTKAGKRCKRRTKNANGRCFQH